MHILLTRPIEDCKDLIIKFKNLGHVVSHMPVIKIEKLNYEIKKVSEFKAIIFTSANAIKYFDTKLIDKKILIFCVGEATERKVRSSGFQFLAKREIDPSDIFVERNVDGQRRRRIFDQVGRRLYDVFDSNKLDNG